MSTGSYKFCSNILPEMFMKCKQSSLFIYNDTNVNT